MKPLSAQRSLLTILLLSALGACTQDSNRLRPPISSIHGTPRASQISRHTVKRGETLYHIARLHHQSVRILAKTNRLKMPYTLYPGQVLRIPARAQPSQNWQKTLPQSAAHKSADQPSTAHLKQRAFRHFHWQFPVTGHLLHGFSETHRSGIDIHTVHHATVRAAAAGKVLYAGRFVRGHGQLIILQHAVSYLTVYENVERLRIKTGAHVVAGQSIAVVAPGTGGGAHDGGSFLHFEIRYRGKSVDPLA